MKTKILTIGGVAAVLALAGCVEPYPQQQRATMQGQAPVYTGSATAYDGYYDGYYGPHTGGYWERDGYYYYLGRDGNYHRDDRGHYRRSSFPGATPFLADNRHHGADNRNVPTNIGSTEGGYYNGYYGPHMGGYWGKDGYYYYLGRDRNYHRDGERHYRHNPFQGATAFRGGDLQYSNDSRNVPTNIGSTEGGYYNGYYGPHMGGYWGRDGYYYYLGRDRNYHRDDQRHYRNNAFQGATAFRGGDLHHGNDSRNVPTNISNTEGGYYNGYYGPHMGGYWGRDGYYYYLGRDRNYHRDDQRHYRHNAFQGATPFRGSDSYRSDDRHSPYKNDPGRSYKR